MRLGKAAVAVALAAVAVTIGGCDGPFMMSDDKAETSKPAQAGAAKQGDGMKNQSSSRDRME